MTRPTCRRVRHELVDRFRAGALVIDVGPQLDHLGECAACRDAVITDRALVIQLRRALAERVGDATPSKHVWLGIVRDAQRAEPPSPVTSWWMTLAGRLRVGTAIAATGLAVVLSVNPQPGATAPSPAATITVPAISSAAPSTARAGTSGVELDTLERLIRSDSRGPAVETAITVWALAPEDGLPPGEHRPADDGSAGDSATHVAAPEPEQVPVLQQPYRSPAPAAEPAGPAPAEEVPDEEDTGGDQEIAERSSVRN